MENNVSIKLTVDGANASVNDVKRVSSSFSGMAANIAHVTTAFAAVTYGLKEVVSAASGVARVVDAFAGVESRLRLVARSSTDLAKSQAQLFAIAQQNRVAYAEVADTYSRFATATRELGTSQKSLLSVTNAVSQAVTISGGTAESARAALVQLGQGMAAGALRGEELNSVMEQTPRLARAIADGMGVSIGQLRKMGEQGEITAEALVTALEKMSPALQAEFNRMTPTIAGSFQVLSDATGKWISEFDNGIGASQTLATVMRDAGKAIGDAAKTARQFGEDAKPLLNAAAWTAGAVAATKMATALSKVEWGLAAIAVAARANPVLLGLGALGWAATTDMSGYGTSMKSGIGNVDAFRRSDSEWDEDMARLERDMATAAPFPGAKPLSEMREYAQLAIDIQKDWNRKAIDIAKTYANSIALAGDDKTEVTRLEAERNARLIQLAKDSEKAMQKVDGDKAPKVKDIEDAAVAQAKAYAQQYEAAIKLAQGIELEAAAGRKLLPVEEALANARLTLNDAQVQEVEKALAGALLIEKRTAIEKEATEQAKVYADAIKANITPLEEHASRLEAENETYGKTISQIEAAALARLEEARAIAAENGAMPAHLEFLDREIEARRRIVAASSSIEVKTVAKKSAEDSAKAWEKFADDIERSLTDSLYRSFEAGKDFGETFADSLKNTFKSMVLKVAVQAIVSPVTGALQSAMTGNPASMGMFGLNTLSAGGSLYNLATGNVGAGLYGQFAQSAIGQSLGLYTAGAGTLAGTAVGAGLLNGAGTVGLAAGVSPAVAGIGGAAGVGGTAAAGSMTALGTALPYIGIGMAVLSAMGAFSDEEAPPEFGFHQRIRGTDAKWDEAISAGNARYAESAFGIMRTGVQHTDDNEGIAAKLADKYLKPLVMLDNAVASFLDKSQVSEIQTALDDWGTSEGKSPKSISKQIAARLGLITDEIGGVVDEIFDQFDASIEEGYALTLAMLRVQGDAAYEALARDLADNAEATAGGTAKLIDALKTVNDSFDAFGLSIYDVSAAGAEAASSLIGAFGGVDQFKASVSAYYDMFYSDEEKLAASTRALSAEFEKLNLALPASKTAFRDLVDAAVGDTQASLIKLSPAFAEVTAASERAIAKIEGDISRLESEKRAYESERDRIIGSVVGEYDSLARSLYALHQDTAALRRLDIETVDPINRNLQQFVWMLEDSVGALDAYRQHLDGLASAGEGIAAYVAQLRGGATGNLAALARSTYGNDLAMAQQGDIGASGRIVSSAQAYLEQIKATAGSRTTYDIAATRIAAQLDALPATQTYAERQIEALEKINASIGSGNQALGTLATSIATAMLPNFAAIDIDTSGFLTLSELQEALDGVATAQEIADFVAKVDLNNDERISKFELTLSSLGQNFADAIGPYFGEIDLDTSGFLTLNELQEALGGVASDAEISALMTKLDTDGNKQISNLELIAASTNSTDEKTGSVESATRQQIEYLKAQTTAVSNNSTYLGTLNTNIASLIGAINALENTSASIATTPALPTVPTVEQIAATTPTTTPPVSAPPATAADLPGYASAVSTLKAINNTYLTDAKIANIAQADAISLAKMTADNADTSYDSTSAFTNEKMSKAIAAATGFALSTVEGWGLGWYALNDLSKALGIKGATIKSYDIGTSYVPQDMLANIHKGEIIIDPQSSDVLRRYGISTQADAAVVAEIRALREEVSNLRAEARATANNTYKTQKSLERVIPEGDAMEVRLVA